MYRQGQHIDDFLSLRRFLLLREGHTSRKGEEQTERKPSNVYRARCAVVKGNVTIEHFGVTPAAYGGVVPSAHVYRYGAGMRNDGMFGDIWPGQDPPPRRSSERPEAAWSKERMGCSRAARAASRY